MVEPTAYPRRPFAWRKLLEAGARFEELGGAAIAASYANATDEDATARRLGLAELSTLPRWGLKGAGTADWLASAGLVVPAVPNTAAPQPDGSLALRLAANEIFLLGDLAGRSTLGKELAEKWQAAGVPPASPRGFPVPRQESHTWMLVSGEQAAAMLAKLCGVDLRPAKFANHAIAQTSAAKMSVVICRDDRIGPSGAGTLAYHLLCDSASAGYLWDCVLDAMAEFGGGLVGHHAVIGLG